MEHSENVISIYMSTQSQYQFIMNEHVIKKKKNPGFISFISDKWVFPNCCIFKYVWLCEVTQQKIYYTGATLKFLL